MNPVHVHAWGRRVVHIADLPDTRQYGDKIVTRCKRALAEDADVDFERLTLYEPPYVYCPHCGDAAAHKAVDDATAERIRQIAIRRAEEERVYQADRQATLAALDDLRIGVELAIGDKFGSGCKVVSKYHTHIR